MWNKKINKILCKIESGRISVNRGIKLINKIKKKKSHFFNIYITSKDSKFRIPIKLPISMFGIIFKIINRSVKIHNISVDKRDVKLLKKFARKNLKYITIVDIDSTEDASVKILFS